MSTIVVGVDDSSRADDATTLARRLAPPLHADLLLVSAYPYEVFDAAHERPEYEAWIRRRAAEALDRQRSALTGLSVDTLAVPAFSPARALYDAAGERDAVAIVIGATHRAVEGRVAVGSVAERLLNGAPCPIVVAPRGYQDSSRMELGMIGVAYQPTDAGRAALAAAMALAGCGGRVQLLTVADPGVWRTDADHQRASAQELADAQREVAHRHLAEAQAGMAPAVRKGAELLIGDPVDELVVESGKLDLLVCGSREYGPVSGVHVGGVSKGLMHAARCPVMIVPPSRAER